METSGQDIVKRIDLKLKEKNLKRKAAADYAGISTQALTDWNKRGSIPAADTALKIADFLDISVEWLITGKDPEQLSAEERTVIELYRSLPETGKRITKQHMKILAAELNRKRSWNWNTNGHTESTSPMYVAEPTSPYYPSIPNDAEILNDALVMLPVFGSTAAGTPIDINNDVEDYVPFPKTMLTEKPTNYFWLHIRGYSMTEAGISNNDLVLIRKKDHPIDGKIMLVRYKNCSTLKRIYINDRGTTYLCWEDGSGKRIAVTSEDYEVQGILEYIAHKPEV